MNFYLILKFISLFFIFYFNDLFDTLYIYTVYILHVYCMCTLYMYCMHIICIRYTVYIDSVYVYCMYMYMYSVYYWVYCIYTVGTVYVYIDTAYVYCICILCTIGYTVYAYYMQYILYSKCMQVVIHCMYTVQYINLYRFIYARISGRILDICIFIYAV